MQLFVSQTCNSMYFELIEQKERQRERERERREERNKGLNITLNRKRHRRLKKYLLYKTYIIVRK